MLTTRLDMHKRLELLNNRATYLSKELDLIEEEVGLLTKLRTLYNTTREDPIDDAPDNTHISESLSAYSPKPVVPSIDVSGKHARNGNSDKILALIATGPATYNELLSASGFTKRQLSDSLYSLKKKDQIDKQGTTYMLKALSNALTKGDKHDI